MCLYSKGIMFGISQPQFPYRHVSRSRAEPPTQYRTVSLGTENITYHSPEAALSLFATFNDSTFLRFGAMALAQPLRLDDAVTTLHLAEPTLVLEPRLLSRYDMLFHGGSASFIVGRKHGSCADLLNASEGFVNGVNVMVWSILVAPP